MSKGSLGAGIVVLVIGILCYLSGVETIITLAVIAIGAVLIARALHGVSDDKHVPPPEMRYAPPRPDPNTDPEGYERWKQEQDFLYYQELERQKRQAEVEAENERLRQSRQSVGTAFDEMYRNSERGRRSERIRQNKAEGIACCPKCGSTSLSVNKKGYSFVKGVLMGPIGGTMGMNKLWITCLNCGHRFRPGKKR